VEAVKDLNQEESSMDKLQEIQETYFLSTIEGGKATLDPRGGDAE